MVIEETNNKLTLEPAFESFIPNYDYCQFSKDQNFSMSAHKEDQQNNLLEGIGDIVEDERTKKDLAKYGQILSTLSIIFPMSIWRL